MLKSVVDKLERRIYAMSIKSLKRCAAYDGTPFGFDTEYDARTKKLLSFQLWYGGAKSGDGKGVFIPTHDLSPSRIVRSAVELCGFVPERILLITWFSLAELQHMDVRGAAYMVREFARGSLDVTFISRNYGGVEVEVFDLARWYDFVSLASASKSIGEEKLDFAREKMSWKILNTVKGRKYAIHDAYLCSRLFSELRAQFASRGVDIVSVRTPASASASVFRLEHVGEDQEFRCDENRARWAAVMGTWGGRAEVFRRGRLEGKWYENDIQSAYPSAACSISVFPVQGSWHRCVSLSCARRDVGGFVHLRFSFKSNTMYPCLPVPTEDGSIIYPLSGESWCSSYEASLAQDMGARLRLVEGWGYVKGTSALSAYMKKCLAARAKATGAGRTMWKLLANSIIGKFAQRTDRVQVSKLYQLAKACRMDIEDLVEMGYGELQILAQSEGIQLDRISLGQVWMPEWNGLITGYTRARLGRAIVRWGAVYCHTDSVWAPRRADLAGWDVKGTGRATIIRTRFAALWGKESHIAHHSVWTRNVAEQMLKRFDGKEDHRRRYPKSRPLKFREAIKRGDIIGRWIEEDDAGYWHLADTRWDGKRCLLEDGTNTRPWKDLEEYEAWKESQ